MKELALYYVEVALKQGALKIQNLLRKQELPQ